MFELFQEVLAHARRMWRFRWYALLLAWLVAIVGWTGVFILPDKYSVTSRVHVDTDSILRPLLRGLAIEPDVSQRLLIMTKTLLSRPNMEKLARMTDMDIKANTPRELDAIVTRLQKDITLTTSRGRDNLYLVSYTGINPKQTQEVVQNLLSILIESSFGQSRENSDTAQKFLTQQIVEYESRMNVAISNLEKFKKENAALMPTLRNGYLQTLQRIDQELDAISLRVKELNTKRKELNRQLSGNNQADEEGVKNTAVVTSYDERIAELNKQKSELLLRYTEVHPQVLIIRDTLEQLEERRKKEIQAMSPEKRNSAFSESSSVYQQLKITLAEAETELSVLKTREIEFKQKKKVLEEKIGDLPRIESELKRLDQDYEFNRSKYAELVQRRETASLSEQAEQAGDSVKIKIIDPPRVPYTPSGPNRPLLNAGVLFASLGLGLALTFLLSQLRPVVYDLKKLREVTGLPVLGGVSRVWSDELKAKKRIEYGGFITAATLLFAGYGVTIIL